jgi:hypothetical protein
MPVPSRSSVVQFSEEVADSSEQTHAVWIRMEGEPRRVLCTFDDQDDALAYLETLKTGIYYNIPYSAGVSLAVKTVTFADIKTLELSDAKGPISQS